MISPSEQTRMPVAGIQRTRTLMGRSPLRTASHAKMCCLRSVTRKHQGCYPSSSGRRHLSGQFANTVTHGAVVRFSAPDDGEGQAKDRPIACGALHPKGDDLPRRVICICFACVQGYDEPTRTRSLVLTPLAYRFASQAQQVKPTVASCREGSPSTQSAFRHSS